MAACVKTPALAPIYQTASLSPVREAQVRYSKDTSPLEVGGCRTARLY